MRATDDADFTAFVAASSRRLLRSAYLITGNVTEAEDLLQDIVLTAHRKLGLYKGESSLGTWLYAIPVPI